MKFQFKNLGLLDSAEIDLSDLTIICGENNTGKTYATYAVYGFLRSWKQLLRKAMISRISPMVQPGARYQINLEEIFKGKINEYFEKMGEGFKEIMHDAFAAKEEAFIKC